jgi:hypothetical protein
MNTINQNTYPSEATHETLRVLFGDLPATKIEQHLNRSKNGQETFHGHIIRGLAIADRVADLLWHMTGDPCTVIEHGKNTYVVVRETSSGEVLA